MDPSDVAHPPLDLEAEFLGPEIQRLFRERLYLTLSLDFRSQPDLDGYMASVNEMLSHSVQDARQMYRRRYAVQSLSPRIVRDPQGSLGLNNQLGSSGLAPYLGTDTTTDSGYSDYVQQNNTASSGINPGFTVEDWDPNAEMGLDTAFFQQGFMDNRGWNYEPPGSDKEKEQ